MNKQNEVRRKTFEDVVADKPLLKLPVVFSGTLRECIAWCQKQPGYITKNAKNQIYGIWYYNKEESIALMIT
jgi:hypothetical protein